MKPILIIAAITSLILPSNAYSEPLTYSQARKIMYSDIFYDHRETLYCGASFDDHREIDLPAGFVISSHKKRATRAETEHIVPVLPCL